MKFLKTAIIFISLMISSAAWSGTYWVGNSAACTGSNVHFTLDQALLTAALNGDSTDEIRLTRTVSYTGNSAGNYTLTDWSSSGAGVLTLVGGYPDCFTAINERTLVGNSNTSSFTINTNNTSTSQVTLRNLILTGNASRGVVARGGAVVFLDNVDINNNGFSGVDIGGGAFVDISANSLVRFNENINNPFGGGVRCTEANSSVIIRGRVEKNRAQKGGNVFVSTGCYAELKDGMRIIGGANSGGGEAVDGGGIYVDNGGELFADGRANRVIIDNNATTRGGGLFVNGTGFVLLQNTHFNNNSADQGAAIFAQGGGVSSPQLIMDQTADCNLLFSCSEIQNSRYRESTVEASNSMVVINRTVIEKGQFASTPSFLTGLITSKLQGEIRLNRVGIINNQAMSILSAASGDLSVSHLTAAGNTGIGVWQYSIFLLGGTVHIENSIFDDTLGAEDRSGNSGDIIGKCNLIDNQTDWPFGTYHVGTPTFSNLAGGDARQLAGSFGVDMCLRDSFAWSSEVDIENQAAPVNENTNPQGLPGEIGGLYDAGFDEVYDNIGPDEFLLTIQKEGSGEGVVISNPSGISCGVDCSEVYFNGTIVTLFASPITGSEFIGWLNCPLVNQDDECLTNVQSSHTIRAVFAPDDLIFYDGFD